MTTSPMTTSHKSTNALITDSRFTDPDAAFRLLIEAHRGLPEDASAALNARLVLVLANHAGDMTVLRDAIMLARKGLDAKVA